MEKLRADKLRACCIMIQKHVKGYLYKNKYRTMRKAALAIQKYTRGLIARRYDILLLLQHLGISFENKAFLFLI